MRQLDMRQQSKAEHGLHQQPILKSQLLHCNIPEIFVLGKASEAAAAVTAAPATSRTRTLTQMAVHVTSDSALVSASNLQ